MLSTILTIALFWVVFFSVTMTTHYIYNVRMVDIKPFSYWDKPPFKCYKCFTTWCLVSVYLMSGILLADVVYTVFGITLASLYGWGLYKDEKERYIQE